MSDLRFLLAVPFGIIAELFARIALWISGGELDCDFNYIYDRKDNQ